MFPGPASDESSFDVEELEEDACCDDVRELLMLVKAEDSADSSEALTVPFETSD
jgi:hypothetical protein